MNEHQPHFKKQIIVEFRKDGVYQDGVKVSDERAEELRQIQKDNMKQEGEPVERNRRLS